VAGPTGTTSVTGLAVDPGRWSYVDRGRGLRVAFAVRRGVGEAVGVGVDVGVGVGVGVGGAVVGGAVVVPGSGQGFVIEHAGVGLGVAVAAGEAVGAALAGVPARPGARTSTPDPRRVTATEASSTRRRGAAVGTRRW